MNVALPPQHHFLRVGVLFELDRRIFVDQPADGAGQFDIVLAPFGVDRQTKDRLRTLGPHKRRGLTRRGQYRTGRNILHTGQPDHLAYLGRRDLFLLGAGQAQQPGYACSIENHSLGDRAAPDARQ